MDVTLKLQFFFLVFGFPYLTKNADGSMVREILSKIRIPFESGQEFLDKGNKCLEEERYVEAIENYSKAIDKNSGIKEYQFLRGYCHLKRYDLDDAISDFKAVIPIEGGARYMACSCLFQAWFKAGNEEDANEYAGRLLQWHLVEIGEHLELILKDNDLALWCYTKAIDKNPKDYTYYKYRALHHFRMGKFDLAVSDFEKLTPRGLSIYGRDLTITCSEAMYKVGKFREAIDVIFSLSDPFAEELVKLGNRLISDKKMEEARHCYGAARAKYPHTRIPKALFE